MSERYKPITLPSGGAIAGIPGDHAPGSYIIDWQGRTIRPALEQAALEAAESPDAREQPPTREDVAPEVVGIPDLQKGQEAEPEKGNE